MSDGRAGTADFFPARLPKRLNEESLMLEPSTLFLTLAAMREGRPMSHPRHALVQRAAKRLWDTQGRLSEEELKTFNDERLSTAELLEIISVIGWYVTSTLTNNLARTEIDPEFLYQQDDRDVAA